MTACLGFGRGKEKEPERNQRSWLGLESEGWYGSVITLSSHPPDLYCIYLGSSLPRHVSPLIMFSLRRQIFLFTLSACAVWPSSWQPTIERSLIRVHYSLAKLTYMGSVRASRSKFAAPPEFLYTHTLRTRCFHLLPTSNGGMGPPCSAIIRVGYAFARTLAHASALMISGAGYVRSDRHESKEKHALQALSVTASRKSRANEGKG